jgi:hypothetical protein
LLEHHLPSNDRAWNLAQSYFDHGAFFFRPIKREEFVNSVLPSVYNVASQRVRTRINFNAATESSPHSENTENGVNMEPDHGNCHALAMCYFMFALGALFDVNLPPYNAEAERYYDLGRAALSAKAVYDSPSIETVQSIGLMATYHTLAGKKYSRDSAVSHFPAPEGMPLISFKVVSHEPRSEIGTKCTLSLSRDNDCLLFLLFQIGLRESILNQA